MNKAELMHVFEMERRAQFKQDMIKWFKKNRYVL